MSKEDILCEIFDKWDEFADLTDFNEFGDEEVGYEEVDIKDFSSVLKETYQIIRKFRWNFILKKAEKEDTFYFAKLVSKISRCTTNFCMDFRNNPREFSLTCILANTLISIATFTALYPEEEYFLEGKEIPADLPVVGENELCVIDDGRFIFSFNFNSEDYVKPMTSIANKLLDYIVEGQFADSGETIC